MSTWQKHLLPSETQKKNDKERNVVFPSNMDKLYKDFSQITVSMTMGK